MTTVRELHDRAMAEMDAMFALRAMGQDDAALAAAARAFEAERAAVELAFEKSVSAATKFALVKSAAALANDAQLYDVGQDLVMRAMIDPALRDARAALYEHLDLLRTHEHLQLKGIVLSPTEVQVSIAGPEVAPGFAPSDEIHDRIELLHSLAARQAMRLDRQPFEASERKVRRYRREYQPWQSIPRAASFAVTLRFGVHKQIELLPDDIEARAQPERVIQEVANIAEIFAREGARALEKLMEPAYARHAATMFRQLSPAESVNTVGLTVVTGERVKMIPLPRRRDEGEPLSMPDVMRRDLNAPPIVVVEGVLDRADASKAQQLTATIHPDAGASFKFYYDEAAHGDVVRMYWRRRVRASLRRRGHQSELVDIDPLE